jgi:hypothetical protein
MYNNPISGKDPDGDGPDGGDDEENCSSGNPPDFTEDMLVPPHQYSSKINQTLY